MRRISLVRLPARAANICKRAWKPDVLFVRGYASGERRSFQSRSHVFVVGSTPYHIEPRENFQGFQNDGRVNIEQSPREDDEMASRQRQTQSRSDRVVESTIIMQPPCSSSSHPFRVATGNDVEQLRQKYYHERLDFYSNHNFLDFE